MSAPADPAPLAAATPACGRRKIAPQLNADEATDRRLVFHRWLEARRPGETLPGKWFAAACHWFSVAAMFGG
ncbi:MAG: hypothetical protein WDN28_28380 [Chthoniobacter sp.]